MDGKTVFCFLSVIQVVCCMFHDAPLARMSPKTFNKQSDFGFSMAYQKTPRRLVVGAPSEDLQGKVYSCDLNNLTTTTTGLSCDENVINLDNLGVKYNRDSNPEQKFYMGASIAATSDYFFTCAPLLTMDLFKNDRAPDVYGTCIQYTNNGIAHQYTGITDQYTSKTVEEFKKKNSKRNPDIYKINLVGGIGWSTLIDEPNDLLLIAKSSLLEDFYYTKQSEPLKQTIAVSTRFGHYIFTNFRNLGLAITAIKFTSKTETVYACNFMSNRKQTDGIVFLSWQQKRRPRRLTFLKNKTKDRDLFTIEDHNLGSMFGAALGAADINRDGFEELLVGAPAYSDEETVESGALHIYLGGNLESNRMGTILGVKSGARFGTAIAAQDMDGDGISEIIVSAPYEDEVGAVYVFSGVDVLETLMKSNIDKMVTINDLRLTQRIILEDAEWFGFSLQLVSDLDDNGCNELAIGSPSTGAVEIYNCVQSVNVTMTLKQIGEATLSSDTLTVVVCAHVVYPRKPRVIVGELKVMSNITGDGAYIQQPEFPVNFSCVSCTEEWFCENVTAVFTNNERAYYQLTTQAHITTSSKKEFDGSQVAIRPHSRLTESLQIYRHCQGDDCKPHLTVDIEWSSSDPYVIGSTESEVARIWVTNDGNSSYESCVRVRVRGAAAYAISASLPCAPDRVGHLCELCKPLRRSEKYPIEIIMDLSEPTNLYADKILVIEADLYEKCNQRDSMQATNLTVRYLLPNTSVYLQEGMSYNRQVSDKDIIDSKHLVYGIQEYMITNPGPVSWYNVSAVISVEKKSFIESYNESSSKCVRKDKNNEVLFSCKLDLLRNSTQKVMVIQKINKTNIESHFKDDILNITSKLLLYFQHTDETKSKSITSRLTYHRDLTWVNNKLLITVIAVIAAAIMLIILITVLFRYGFFKRKQKERLEVFRESVRRRSSRRSVSGPNNGKDGVRDEGLLMDYDNDSAFEEDVTKVNADKAHADKDDADKDDADKVDADKDDADKDDADKVDADKDDADKDDADKVDADKDDADKDDADKVDADKVNADKVNADKDDSDKVDADKVNADKDDSDKVDADKVDAEKVDADQVNAGKPPSIADNTQIPN